VAEWGVSERDWLAWSHGPYVLYEGEPGVSPHPRSPMLTCAQSGVTLGPEQGEPGADFTPLGIWYFRRSPYTSHFGQNRPKSKQLEQALVPLQDDLNTVPSYGADVYGKALPDVHRTANSLGRLQRGVAEWRCTATWQQNSQKRGRRAICCSDRLRPSRLEIQPYYGIVIGIWETAITITEGIVVFMESLPCTRFASLQLAVLDTENLA
jgi:hypothetical protein